MAKEEVRKQHINVYAKEGLGTLGFRENQIKANVYVDGKLVGMTNVGGPRERSGICGIDAIIGTDIEVKVVGSGDREMSLKFAPNRKNDTLIFNLTKNRVILC